MPDITHDTSINFNANTVAAVASMGNMDRAMMVLSKKSGPAVGSAFAMLGSQAINMTTGFGGAAGGLNALAQSAFAFTPAIGLAAVAVAGIIALMTRKKEAVAASTKELDINYVALGKLAGANNALGESMRARREEMIAEKTVQLSGLESKLKSQEAEDALAKSVRMSGLTADDYAKKLTGQTIAQLEARNEWEAVREATNRATAGTKNYTAEDEARKSQMDQTRLAAQQLREDIDNLNKADVDASKAAKEHAKKLADQRFAIMRAGDAINENERRERTGGEKGELEAINALAEVRTHAEFRTVEAANQAFAMRLEAENTFYSFQLANLEAFNMSEEEAQIRHEAALASIMQRRAETTKRVTEAQNKLTLKAVDTQILAYNVAGSAFERAIRGQLSQHAGFSAFMIQTTGEAIQAVLKSYGTLWAAEAAANALTNPAVAISKARAAAMAGVAVGIVGALTDVAVQSVTKQSEKELSLYDEIKRQEMENAERDAVRDQVRSDLGYDTSPGGGGRSRQSLASTGPVTIYYSQSNVVNGNVYGMDDLFAIMDRYNENLFRRLGLDLSQAVR